MDSQALVNGEMVVRDLIALGGLGHWISKQLGDAPATAINLLGADWLREQRTRRLAELKARTEERLAQIDKSLHTPPNPSIMMPLLVAAQDEADQTLQQMWAALLAASMTNRGASVRRSFIDLLQRLDPADALILCCYARLPPLAYEFKEQYEEAVGRQFNHIAAVARQHGVNQDGQLVSAQALRSLGLLDAWNGLGPGQPSAMVTPLARLFLQAVDPDQKLEFL